MINKKGLSFAVLIGLVIGSLIILVTVTLWAKFGNLLVNDQEIEVNKGTFYRLNYEIDELLANNEVFAKKDGFQMALTKNFAIVGFNKDETVKDGCEPYDVVEKPSRCQDLACLCLFKASNNKAFEDMDLIECKIFPKVEKFVSVGYWFVSEDDNTFGAAVDSFSKVPINVIKNQVGYPYNDGELDYPTLENEELFSPFFLYGQCDGWGRGKNFGNWPYYIEKYGSYVFINFDAYNEKRVEQLV